MINFIIVSHGKMAEGIVDAIKLIVGNQTGVEMISLEEHQSIEDLEEKIEVAIKELLKNSTGVLIFADLFGASPFNMAAKAAVKYKSVEVVTGVNLPMVIESIMQRGNYSISEIAREARESGKQGIRLLSDLI